MPMTRTLSRRALLRAIAAGAKGIAVGGVAGTLEGCLIPSRPAPAIDHPHYPLGAIRRRRIDEGRFRVGASAVDITPPAGSRTWLAGFGFQRRMHEVRDRVSARCLYFDDGVRRVAIVIADVIGLLHPTVLRVRRLVGNGIEVAVASTHNHQSPDTMGYWGPAMLYALPYRSGIDLSYQRVLERRLAAAVFLAAQSAAPARLRFARGAVPPGLVRNLRNPGIYDPRVEVVEATKEQSGEPIGCFVNFACHPETLGDRSHAMSADFPGVVRKIIEEKRGGTAVFANGSLGGMITAEIDPELDDPGRVKAIDRIGRTVAGVALDALERAEPLAVKEVRYRRRAVELASDNALFEYIERVGLVERRARGKGGGILSEVGRLDLGPGSWVFVPGEPTPAVGGRIKARLSDLGVAHPAVIGLGNDELGYILDPAEYVDPRFSYEVSVSMARDTAPAIEAAIAALG